MKRGAWILGLTALVACSESTSEDPVPEATLDPLQRILARPQPAVRTSSPEDLVADVLTVAARTRSVQTEAARRSWNVVHSFVHGTLWKDTPVAASVPRSVDDASELARLDWEILGRVPAPELKRTTQWACWLAGLAGGPRLLALPLMGARDARAPLWNGVVLAVRVECLDLPPLEGLREQRQHPIAPSFSAYVRGELRWRRFLVPLRTVREEGRWWLAIPSHVLGGLTIRTGGL